MGVIHRADARDLNARAHAVLEAAGQLGPPVAAVDDVRYCVGDRVLGLKNRYDLGMLNGELGRSSPGPSPAFAFGWTRGRDVILPLDYVTDHLSHAYARTIHKTQGLTCDVALLLGDDTLSAELGYTALTRGSQENHLYAVVNSAAIDVEGRELDHVIRALGTSRAETAAIDYMEPPALT